jgi:hypothetical protein
VDSETGGVNVVLVIAIIVGVIALLVAGAAFAMAWSDNNPKDTIRHGVKNPEFDNESAE